MGKAKTANRQKAVVSNDYVIGPDGKKYPTTDLELVQRFNVRGGNPRMFWVVKKSPEVNWPKTRGDVYHV